MLSGFINRPTYMPKEKFNEEKREIGVRIQGLIAQGESISKMMEVGDDNDDEHMCLEDIFTFKSILSLSTFIVHSSINHCSFYHQSFIHHSFIVYSSFNYCSFIRTPKTVISVGKRSAVFAKKPKKPPRTIASSAKSSTKTTSNSERSISTTKRTTR